MNTDSSQANAPEVRGEGSVIVVRRRSQRQSNRKRLYEGAMDVSTNTDGPQVEDVTEAYDQGYEADLDAIYPNDFEEPESESESMASTPLKRKLSGHEDLVKRFRRMRFLKRKQPPFSRHAPQSSYGSVGTKRSHSEDSLTESEEVVSDTGTHSGIEHHPVKKRHLNGDSGDKTAQAGFADAMDLDPDFPSSEPVSDVEVASAASNS